MASYYLLDEDSKSLTLKNGRPFFAIWWIYHDSTSESFAWLKLEYTTSKGRII